MRMAYADPPYLGQSGLYREHPDYAGEVDHGALLKRLMAEFSDGWALSCSSPSLRALLPLCPSEIRVLAWVKPFCSWRPSVTPAYAWEPVLLWGGRRVAYRDGGLTVRDYVSAPMTMQRGLAGVKPEAFCFWLFAVLGLGGDDELVDLFPGSHAVTAAWERYRRGLFERRPSGETQAALAVIAGDYRPWRGATIAPSAEGTTSLEGERR